MILSPNNPAEVVRNLKSKWNNLSINKTCGIMCFLFKRCGLFIESSVGSKISSVISTSMAFVYKATFAAMLLIARNLRGFCIESSSIH